MQDSLNDIKEDNMGFKTKTTAVVASMFIVANAVGVQANTAVSSKAATLCGTAFVGCVLPGKTTPKVEPVKQVPAAPAATPVVEEASEKGIFGTLAPILAVAAVIAGVVIAADGGDDDAPTSP